MAEIGPSYFDLWFRKASAEGVHGAGGTQSSKGYRLSVARLPQGCGCRQSTLLKRSGCPAIIDTHRELSNLFI